MKVCYFLFEKSKIFKYEKEEKLTAGDERDGVECEGKRSVGRRGGR